MPQPLPTLRPAAPRRPSLVRLLPYLRPFRRQFALALAMAPLGVAMAVLIPLLLGSIVDGPIAERDGWGVALYALLILAAGAVDAAISLVRRWMLTRATSALEANIRLDLFDTLQALQLGFHKRWESGQLLSRIMSDLGLLRRFMSFGILMLIMNTIQIVVVVSIMVAMHWPLGVAVLASVLPVVAVTTYLVHRFGLVSRQVQDRTGDVASAAEESLHGVRVIRSFGRVPFAFSGFDR
ncbi:MAG TPA: ABC transporter transmembrane domain-containing protein, partial [Arachnia sp.]|nr:ABC transporter transmembrane domain-containing protein [Arachnia sp.]